MSLFKLFNILSVGIFLQFLSLSARAEIFGCIGEDEKLIYRFLPNCIGTMRFTRDLEMLFVTNEYGIWDKNYEPKPAKDTLRILFYSTSIGLRAARGNGMSLAGLLQTELEQIMKSRSMKFGKKRFNKIEVISAPESGYHLIQASLRLDELVPAYNPDVVLYIDPFEALLAFQTRNYSQAENVDPETGLVRSFGGIKKFWPLSKKYEFRVWSVFPYPLTLNRLAVSMELVYFYILHKLNLEKTDPTDLHIKYIEAIDRKMKQYGALPIILYKDAHKMVKVLEYWGRGGEAWRNPEFMARRIVPWSLINSKEREKYNSFMASQANFIDVTESFMEAAEITKKANPDLNHFEQNSLNHFAKKIAPMVIKKILQNSN